MSRPFAVAATSAVLLSALAAQSVAVFPSDHTSRDGARSVYWVPFSYGVTRMSAVYESFDLAIPTGHRITQVGFRRDENSSSQGYRVQLEMYMGPSLKTAADAEATFANNFAGTPVQVYATRIFDLPSLNSQVQQVNVPLDAPYSYDPTRNLAVEWRVHANSNGNAAFNYWLDHANFYSPVASLGQGCLSSGNRTPVLTSQPAAIGGNWFLGLRDAPASSPAILLVGVQALPQGLPIPQAPGCNLFIQPLISLNMQTNSSGGGNFTFPVPDNPWLYQKLIYSQLLVRDVFANSLGFVISNGDSVQFGMDPRMSLIWAQGNSSAVTGSVYRNYGVITLFTHQ